MSLSDRDKDFFLETSYTPSPLELLLMGVFLTAVFCAVVWQCCCLYPVWNTGVYTMGEQLVLAVVYEISLLLSGTFAVGMFWMLIDEQGAHQSCFAVIPMRFVFLQAALLLLSITAVDYVNNVRLLLRGVETEGVIFGRESQGARHEAGSRRNQWNIRFCYTIISQTDSRIRFRAADGKTYLSLPICHVFGESIPADGQSTRVLYLPDDPRISKFPGIGMWAVGFIMMPLGIAALFVFWGGKREEKAYG